LTELAQYYKILLMNLFHPEKQPPKDSFWYVHGEGCPDRTQYILDAEQELAAKGSRDNRRIRAAFRDYEKRFPDPRLDAMRAPDPAPETIEFEPSEPLNVVIGRNMYLGGRFRRFNKYATRATAAVVIGAVGLAGASLWRKHQEEVRVENAKRYVATQEALQSPDILRGLGLCATELRAEAAVSKNKEARKVPIGRPGSAAYSAAAGLAEAEHTPCAPQVSAWQFDQGDLDTKLKPSDVTEFNVPTICHDLDRFERDFYHNGSSLRAKLAIGIISDQGINC
jgi:hypothetical protein